jgi:perosamine synthetase
MIRSNSGAEMNNNIPVCEPLLGGREREYVLDALDSGWISSSGKYIAAFERAFASYIGVKHGIAVANGTVALHLALTALGIKKGDEVIIPDFTMIASAFAVCYTGAKPVFVDAEARTWNIDPSKIEEKVTTKTKAIMAVHIYGHPCEMNSILEISKKHDLKVIEDAAEVHGAEYLGKKCGNLGDIAGFSFFANKIATTGEGGMVVTNDDELAEKCRYFRNLCFPIKGERVHLHNDIGFNYRISNLHAAIGLAQVQKIDFYVARRRENNRFYREYLSEIPGITFQQELAGSKNVYWMNAIVIDRDAFGTSRNELKVKLKKEGIDTRYFFCGMHRQPSLVKYGCQRKGNYEVADWLAENGLYLPSGSGLSESEIERISGIIIKSAGR